MNTCDLTWGVNKAGLCAVYCRKCRHVYQRDMKPLEARIYCREAMHGCAGRAA